MDAVRHQEHAIRKDIVIVILVRVVLILLVHLVVMDIPERPQKHAVVVRLRVPAIIV